MVAANGAHTCMHACGFFVFSHGQNSQNMDREEVKSSSPVDWSVREVPVRVVQYRDMEMRGERKQSPSVARREMKADGSVEALMAAHRGSGGNDPPTVGTPQSLNRNTPPPPRRQRRTIEQEPVDERWVMPESAAHASASRSVYADAAFSDGMLLRRITRTIHEISAQDTVRARAAPTPEPTTVSLVTGERPVPSHVSLATEERQQVPSTPLATTEKEQQPAPGRGDESKDDSQSQSTAKSASMSTTPLGAADQDQMGTILNKDKEHKRLDQERDDGVECPICKGNLRAPLVSPCGHAFCQACVQRIENGRCPECNEPAHPTVYYPCYALAKAAAAAGDKREASWVNNYRLDWLRVPQRYSAAEMRTVADAKKHRIVIALVRLMLDEIGKSSQLGHKRLCLAPAQQRAMGPYFRNVKRILTAEPFRYRCLRVADGGTLILWSHAAGDSESDDDESVSVVMDKSERQRAQMAGIEPR